MSGYVPKTDGEWLSAVFVEIRGLRQDLRDFKSEMDSRVESLEKTRDEQRGGFILVKVALASLAPIGVLAGWLGARLQ